MLARRLAGSEQHGRVCGLPASQPHMPGCRSCNTVPPFSRLARLQLAAKRAPQAALHAVRTAAPAPTQARTLVASSCAPNERFR